MGWYETWDSASITQFADFLPNGDEILGKILKKRLTVGGCDIIIPQTKDFGETKLLQKVRLSYTRKVFQFLDDGKQEAAMKNRKMLLPALLSIALVVSLILPASVAGASVAVPLLDDRSISHLAVDSSSAAPAMALNTPQGQVTPMVAAGGDEYGGHMVGLKSDGTVIAVGDNEYGQCDIGGWTDITQVSAGTYHTVGLRSDGTVVAVGGNFGGQCDVDGWTDITQVAAGLQHTVGVKADGTVVAVGYNVGQCDVDGWTDIVQVAAGHLHTVGVKGDGTVVATGSSSSGQCDVGGWVDIIQVSAGTYHTVGLKSDGTVVAVGSNDAGQCDVGGWTDIIQVAAGYGHTVGLSPTAPWSPWE